MSRNHHSTRAIRCARTHAFQLLGYAERARYPRHTGENRGVTKIREVFGDSPSAGLAGSAQEVAAAVRSYAAHGIERCLIIPLVPNSVDELANVLF